MPELIILEGADRVGKSTLADHLHQTLGYPIFHYGKPDENMVHTAGYFYQYYHLIHTPQNAILDRSWISRLAYETLRNCNPLNLDLYYHLHFKLTEKYSQITYYYLTRPWNSELVKDHLEEIDNSIGYGTLEERKREHYAFDLLFQLLENTPLKMVKYNETL